MNPGVHPITIVEIRKTATGELVSGRCRLIKAQAFLEGRYAKGESGQNAGPGGGMAELHSLQAQKQILQATAAMTKCWNLMKVISPLSRMVTNTEIIL